MLIGPSLVLVGSGNSPSAINFGICEELSQGTCIKRR